MRVDGLLGEYSVFAVIVTGGLERSEYYLALTMPSFSRRARGSGS